MKTDERRSYLVNIIEFKKINKNPFIAAILSFFLGMFGLQRFYLKRKVTGFIFLIISISSLQFGKAYLAAILMFISIIEGIVYIVRGVVLLKEKFRNNKVEKGIHREEIEIMTDKEKDKIVEINQKEKTEECEEPIIIEVSNIETSKIPKRIEFDNVHKIDWIKKLSIPYERSIMQLNQVKQETLNLYEKLCYFIDEQLKNNKSSLNKEVSRIELEGGYYNNILYTIYCIAEGHVTMAYSGKCDYYNSEFPYERLESNFGEKLKNKVFNKARELEKDISFPNDETSRYFNLTENGLPIKWWDITGRFREERQFNEKELNILSVTPSRNTKVWEIYSVNKEIINLYLDIWETISNSFGKNLKWKSNNKETLENIINNKYNDFIYYENVNILASLIKISENTIREVMPNTQILNVDKENNNIKKYLPSELVEAINNRVIKYKENMKDEDLKEILKDMLKNDPDDWKLKVEEILIQIDDERIEKLITYKKDKDFIRMAKEIVKNTEDEKLLLLCLYGIEREENLSNKNAQLLEKLIYQNNILKYKKLVESREELSLELLDRLLKLKYPIRKKIDLDMEKVKDSKEELDKTIDIVEEYIGDEEENEKADIEEEVIEGKHSELKFKYEEFLKLILSLGAIDVESGKKIAMNNGTLLNAFISDVNQELYEYIQDQTIVIEDNYIKIDEFYIDMVRELMINE